MTMFRLMRMRAVCALRELAFQIKDTFQALGTPIGLKCATIVGGIDMVTQAVALAKKPHVIIGEQPLGSAGQRNLLYRAARSHQVRSRFCRESPCSHAGKNY